MLPEHNRATFTSVYLYGSNDKPLEIRNVCMLFGNDFPRSSNLDQPIPPRESHGLDVFRQRARGRHAGALTHLNTDISYRSRIGRVEPTQSYHRDFDYRVEDGRIYVSVGGDIYEIISQIRFAGEPWQAFDGPALETDQVVSRRRIVRRDSHLEIRDTFTNRTGTDQPVIFVNMIDTGDPAEITEFRLGGQLRDRFFACTSPMDTRLTGVTPVAYVAREGSAAGLVLEDDAYRNQATWMTWDGVLAAGDDLFYLEPRSSYTVVWKVYPLGVPNYYDLINAVRDDWGLYQRIDGLFGFVHPATTQAMYEDARYKTAESRAAFVRDTGIDVAAATFRYSGAEDKARILYGGEPVAAHRQGAAAFAEWRDHVRAAGVEVACLPYMDVHICRLTDGETLGGLRERFPESLPLNAWGEPVAYRTGWLYCVLPQLGNPVSEHLMQLLELYLDELDFDGIYLDEWDHSRARVSYGHRDGVSALLDEHGEIIKKIGFVPMLAKDFHVAFAAELVKRDAVIFANQFDDTLTAAQLPIVHFAEPVAYDSYLLSAAQLSRSPLALHLKPRVNLFETVREYLKRGVLTCYYWYYLHGDHVLKHCYPITVREIRPGVIIGDDRIVTCASGTFTFGRAAPLRAIIYGPPDGLPERTLDAGGGEITLDLGDGRIAVIVEQ
jgi:hypothetical protein